jgi:hypothetical protein
MQPPLDSELAPCDERLPAHFVYPHVPLPEYVTREG